MSIFEKTYIVKKDQNEVEKTNSPTKELNEVDNKLPIVSWIFNIDPNLSYFSI